MRVLGRLLIATTTVLAGACAGHRVDAGAARAAAMAELARADERLLDGCYRCLAEARDTYVRLAGGPVGGRASEHRFGAELLILLREKELSIDTSASMDRVQAAAVGLAVALDAGRAIDLAGMIPANEAGVPEASYSAFMRARMATARMLDDDIEWLAGGSLWAPVREYLALSVQCSVLGRPLLTAARRWRDGDPIPDGPPLLRYRRALCAGAAGHPVLEGLAKTASGLAEASYALARSAPLATERAHSTRTRELVVAALHAFPRSPAVSYLMATIEQAGGDCREALRLYDVTLALAGPHENAQLGRTACLTSLGRTDEAIAAATTLVDWESSNLRDGFYWRAHNRRVLGDLSRAREDIERSKQVGESRENRTLAGIIEYEQDDLGPALADLDRAWALGAGRNCTAAWYQGLVHARRETWPEAGDRFDRAMRCYARDIADDRDELRRMEARTDLAPAVQRAQIDSLRQALGDDERRRWDSAMNAANCFARAGDPARAEASLAVASEDPLLADEIADVRALVDYTRRSPR